MLVGSATKAEKGFIHHLLPHVLEILKIVLPERQLLCCPLSLLSASRFKWTRKIYCFASLLVPIYIQFWTCILHTQVRREQKLLGFNSFSLCSKVSLSPLYKPGNITMHFIWEWFGVHMAFLIPLSHLLLASDILILSDNSYISLPV